MQTFKELRTAIKQAKWIFIQARFSTSEHWLKITKSEAMYLIKGSAANNPLPDDASFSWCQNQRDLYIEG